MSDNGISAATQDGLIAKMKAGKALDATTGAAPVSTTTNVANGFKTTRSVYADGSVSIIQVEQPKVTSGGISPQASVDGCSVNSGSGYSTYRGCVVRGANPIVSASFRTDFQILKGTYDKISFAGYPDITTRAASWDNLDLQKIRMTESPNGDAQVALVAKITQSAGGQTLRQYQGKLIFFLGKDKYSVTNAL